MTKIRTNSEYMFYNGFRRKAKNNLYNLNNILKIKILSTFKIITDI